MKKIIRYLTVSIKYIFIKITNKFLFPNGVKIIPSLESLDFFKIQYSNKTRRYLFRNQNKKIEKIIIDTSLFESELCLLGKKYETNKSSLNFNGPRSGFTGFYSLVFCSLRDKKINFAEIGIEKNASTKMWRKYFKKANIYLFEYDRIKINNAKKNKLQKTFYSFIDVTNKKIIKESFKRINKKFDIIIDDSTHFFEHQLNIINNTFEFLKPGGLLIIEDIYKRYDEDNYNRALSNLKKKFKKIIFVEVYHSNNYTSSWKNEKLLVLIK